MLDAMMKDKERFLPKKGYNVVGVDDFELPGDQLYLVGRRPTREAAEKLLKDFQGRNPGHQAHIYGPEDK